MNDEINSAEILSEIFRLDGKRYDGGSEGF